MGLLNPRADDVMGASGILVREFKPIGALGALPSCRRAYAVVKQAMELLLLHKSFGALPENWLNFPTPGGGKLFIWKKQAVLGSKMTNLSDFRDPAAFLHSLVQFWGGPGTYKGSFFGVTDIAWLYGWHMGRIILVFTPMGTVGKVSLQWEWFHFAQPQTDHHHAQVLKNNFGVPNHQGIVF